MSATSMGLRKVKEEVTPEQNTASDDTANKSSPASATSVNNINTLPAMTTPSVVTPPAGAAGLAAMPASMFSAFPGVGGFFNAAAFAAAAAAAFPPITTNNSGVNSSNPPAMSSMLGPAKAKASSKKTASTTPSSKRRKRGREEADTTLQQQAEAIGSDVAAAASTASTADDIEPNVSGFTATTSSLPKLEAFSPQLGGSGGGAAGGTWATTTPAVAPMNVLTPNMFGGEMSNQERKERRKIRNRMSAQQHRERQRNRVDTLEESIREREEEISQLKGQVASLTEKNQRLTSRVLQLEAGECPDLEAVLNGLGDETESGSSRAPAQDPARATVPSATALPTAKIVVPAGEGMQAAAPIGEEDTDSGGITTDQAHSSSESDSDDLSPMSTIDERTRQPSTPPLSPTRSQCDAPAPEGTAGLLSSTAFSLSGLAPTISEAPAATDTTPSTLPGAPTHGVMIFTVSPAVLSSAGPHMSGFESGGIGSGGVGDAAPPQQDARRFSTEELLLSDDEVMSLDVTGTDPGADLGIIPSTELKKDNWIDVETETGGATAVTAEGLQGVIGKAGNGVDTGMDIGSSMFGGVGADGRGERMDESDLTMAALDPMEIDALLACAGDDDHDRVGPITGAAGTAVNSGDAASNLRERTAATMIGNSSNSISSGSNPHELEAGCRATDSSDNTRATREANGKNSNDDASPSTNRSIEATMGGVSATLTKGFRGGGNAGRDVGDAGAPAGVQTRGGVASTVAAGVMGALCLAGVVVNSGTQGGGASPPGTELVVSGSSQGNNGRRVLSSAMIDEEDDDGEYVNMTEPVSWVFHPVEAEPWRWRATAARERRAPWVWERALSLFGEVGLGGKSSRERDEACQHGSSAAGLGGELIRSDDLFEAFSDVDMEAFPPIAAPPGGVTDGIDPDEDDLILEDSDQDLSEFLGKELDLFFEPSAVLSAPSAAAAAYHSGGVRSSHAYEAGGGGSGAATSARGRHVGVPSERTSYIFCPEAHGMMSGGMIESASKATYDHHHPGARPCSGALSSADRSSGGKGRAMNRNDQINVVGMQRPQILPESSEGDAPSLALVSSNHDVFFGSSTDEEAVIDGVPGEGGRRRKQGPSPIHRGSAEGLENDDGGATGPSVFAQEIGHTSSDAEYLTMLVPSSALDWGSSSLAVRAALNASSTPEPGSSGGVGEEDGGAWVEIDCQILNARVVQDVSFSG